jgi:hypothetical protein
MKSSFSLIIPTRDRPSTLSYAIQSCINQDYTDLEIIILDNLCDHRTKVVVEQFADDRIVHLRSDRRLSMTENYERGLNAAKGDYICIIGDDDVMMPHACNRLANLVKSCHSPEAFIMPMADYWWPGTQRMLRDGIYKENHIYFQQIPSHASGFVDPKNLYHNFLVGNVGYRQMAGFYHKCVKRSLLDRIIRNERYIHSSIPDVYAAIALTASAKTIYAADFYLCLGGTSPASTGLAQVMANPDNEQAQKTLINWSQEDPIPLHSLVNRTGGSIKLYEYECFLQARDAGVLALDDELSIKSLTKNTIMEAYDHAQSRALDIVDCLENVVTRSVDSSREACLASVHEARVVIQSLDYAPRLSIGNSSPVDLSAGSIDAAFFGVRDAMAASSLLLMATMVSMDAKSELSVAELNLQLLRSSTSWKLTKPIRLIVALVNRLFLGFEIISFKSQRTSGQ